MKKDYSPFTPGQPVPLEFFVGRAHEIERFRNKVRTACTGRLQTLFVSGERGIGKSSLASFVRHISDAQDNVLGLHVFLGGVTSLEEMVRRVFDRLLKGGSDTKWFPKIKDLFGDHIQQVGLFGVNLEFKPGVSDLERLVHGFAPALRNLMQNLKGEKQGLLIVLDDINGLATSEAFANWVKSLVDEIATSNEQPPLPLCLVLVGLDEKRQSLIQLNPSLARIFDLVDIAAWKTEETSDFFEATFGKADVSVDPDALELLARYSGGLPVLAHELGDAAFRIDDDDRISRDDASQAVIEAAEIVGRKHLEPQVFSAIRSDKYRAILRKIAKTPFEITFNRSDLRSRLNQEELKVSDNFLTKMKNLGVVQPDMEQGRGAYRFQNLLHYLYFWLEAERAKESRD